MKRFQEQLQSKAKSVKLTAAERRDVKERLQAYMEYHPLPADLRKPKPAAKSKQLMSEPFAVVQLPFAALFKTAGISLAVLLLAVPFVAERAVPGDSLYAVKVQFNEELRSTLTFSGVEKVEWETERLNRRIAEARLLASEGRLTEEVEAEVAAAVKEHSESAQKEIAELRTVDADEAAIAAIALDTTLETQASTLKQEEEESVVGIAAETRPTTLLATALDESRAQGQQDAALSTSTPPSFEKLVARVEQNTTRIYELRQVVEEYAAEERLAEVDRRVADVERIITDAVAAVEADETGARQQLVDALQRTQKLIIFMTELDVMETVDIETVVPVVLTDDEKQAERQSLLAALREARAELAVLLETDVLLDEGVNEKAVTSLTLIDESLIELASTSAHTVFVERADDALTLANDMTKALSLAIEKSGQIVIEPTPTSTEPIADTEVDAATSTDNGTVDEEDTSDVEVSTTTATTS